MAYEIFDVIRRKVPLMTLFVQMLIVNIFYRECVSDDGHMIGFWIYFPTLSLACFIWEMANCVRLFSQIYQHKTLKSRIIFGFISSLISTLTFCTASYYVEAGRPFSCIYPYNQVAAPIMFYLTITILVIISLFEHYKWSVIGSLLPMTVHNTITVSPDDVESGRTQLTSGNFEDTHRLSITNPFAIPGSGNKKGFGRASQERLLQSSSVN